jgi:hypothetical protein
MPAMLYILVGFMAGLFVMMVISMYRYLFRILHRE